MSKTYPIDATDAELAQKSAEFSTRVLAYDPKKGNAENLIKDSVLFNVTYIERQNRASARATRQMLWLAWTTSIVAAGSLVVGWMAYDGSLAADKWQAEQLRILQSIASNTARVPPAMFGTTPQAGGAIAPVPAASK